MSLYKMNISDKTIGAAQDSDPEVQKMIFDNRQNNNETILEPTNQDQNFFQRLLNFVNPFTSAGAAEPDISPITGLPVNTNTGSFPFVDVSQFAEGINQGKSLEQINKENIIKKFNLSNQGTTLNTNNTQSGFATNFPIRPVKSGITESTAVQEFKPEAPFRIINGQKVYIDDVLGIKAAEEKSNMFTPKRTIPQLTMDTVSEGIKSLVSKFAPGMSIANMLDKFDSLPYMDRKFIKSRMAKVGKSGGDFYVDPKSGLFKDKAGLGIRSLRGNYAKTIDKEFLRYDKAVKRAEDKYGVTWDGTQFVGENAEIANKRNRRNIDMFKFFRDQKTERDRMRKEIIEKAKKQKSPPIQRGFPTSTSTGEGGLTEAEKKAFAPRQDTFTKGKTVTLSDGRKYGSPK